MKKLLGINFIKSKNDVNYVLLHLVDDSYSDTVNHQNLWNSDPKTSWGETVSTEFVLQDELKYGEVEVTGGTLRPGCKVRIFKENKNGMDKVSLIQVFDVPDAESINADVQESSRSGKSK